MLQEKGNNRKGGIIVLVTDGQNSPGYLDISDVKEDIINAGIRVITVAFGCVKTIKNEMSIFSYRLT
jgi:hypothetical protein